MGEIRTITCKSCGREWELQTGSGLQYGRIEKAASVFPENLQRGILKSMSDMEVPIYDFAYRPAYCEYCCQLVSIPVLTPMEKQGFIGGCPICGRQAELIQSVEQTPCPVCGEKALWEEETGTWD